MNVTGCVHWPRGCALPVRGSAKEPGQVWKAPSSYAPSQRNRGFPPPSMPRISARVLWFVMPAPEYPLVLSVVEN